MKAGNSNLDIGTRIKIKKVNREDEQHLVGHTGILAHPFLILMWSMWEFILINLISTSRIFVIYLLTMILNPSSSKVIFLKD